jgi:predicted nicotinamide N-methyase
MGRPPRGRAAMHAVSPLPARGVVRFRFVSGAMCSSSRSRPRVGGAKVAVWNSGILLTRLLDRMNLMSNSSLFEGKTTLELGCGAALSSIAVGRLAVGVGGGGGGAASPAVIATDSNPEVLDLARRNIERNGLSGVVRTAMLQWGSVEAAADYGDSADVVIGSDLTYNSGSWMALAETMSAILKPEGIVIYLVRLHHDTYFIGVRLPSRVAPSPHSHYRSAAVLLPSSGAG